MMAETIMDFLLEEANKEVIEEVVISERLACHTFKIKPIGGEMYANLQTMCTTRKKKNKVDFDQKRFTEQVILLGCMEPNFKDADTIAKAKVTTPEQLLYKLLHAGEINTLGAEILKLSGFNQDMEELEEEAKN